MRRFGHQDGKKQTIGDGINATQSACLSSPHLVINKQGTPYRGRAILSGMLPRQDVPELPPLLTTRSEVTNMMVEFIECVIHYILYIREVYAPSLFEKIVAYSVPTFKCTHPTVCDYIRRILDAMRPLLAKGHINKIVICPCKATIDHTPLESFTFALKGTTHQSETDLLNSKHTMGIPRDTITQFLRSFLLKLSVAESLLQPIPPGLDITFYVMLQLSDNHVEDVGQYRIEGDERLRMPWIQCDMDQERIFEDEVVIPLKSVHNEVIQLQLYVQERKDLKIVK